MIMLSLLVVVVTVLAILRQAEVRLCLVLGATALGLLAGHPEAIVTAFLHQFTNEQFLLPIGTCMGFAFVLKHTGCDQHLIRALIRPLRRARGLLVPGVVLVGVVVNVPIISQSSTAVAVGSVLAPILRAAGVSPVTAAAALAMGSSIGGELLNPGAPELNSVASATGGTPIQVVGRVWPLLLVHLTVAVPLFWLVCRRAEASPGAHGEEGKGADVPRSSPAPLASTPPPRESGGEEGGIEADAFRVNPLKAMVPLLPLLLLFLTALPPPLRALEVPRGWLLAEGTRESAYGVRLIGAAMLVGVVVAALSAPEKAGGVGKAFFEGAGYALANITSLIIAANCFGVGVKLSGLAEPLKGLVEDFPRLLVPLASAFPLGFGWVSGSGMAATESLYRFYVGPSQALGADPLHVGAVVSLSAAAGRTLSPVSAVVLMSASLNGTTPLDTVRRMALPMLAGLTAMVIVAAAMG